MVLDMTLLELKPGVLSRVLTLQTPAPRVLESCGLWPGREVEVLRQAPWGGPLHVRVGTAEFLLRRDLAKLVELSA